MKKLLILILAATFSQTLMASEEPQTDSLVKIYYERCRNALRKDVVLPLCDTLFQLAAEKGDLDMQGTALVFRSDYYYGLNNMDSLQACMQRTRQFAQQYNQPKPYYFVWNQIIKLYTKSAKYTLAQYEIEKLIRQAEEEDYKFGVGTAYYNLGNIYQLRGITSSAIEYYQKAINYILDNDLDQYSLNSIYSWLSSALSSMKRYDEALEALNQSLKYTKDDGLKYVFDAERAVIYAAQGNSEQAMKLLQGVEQNKPIYYPYTDLLKTRIAVYRSCGRYPEALKTTNELLDILQQSGDQDIYYSDLYNSRAQTYAKMGDYRKAFDDLNHYLTLLKEKVSKEGESTLAEFSTLMGVEQLNAEKAELAQQAQAERLRLTQSIVGALIFTLLLATIFIIVQMRMNRKLKSAKSAAEEANRAKSQFISNVTHEVNTPLNSIIGFAELAASEPDQIERQKYLEILHENSEYLQKIIDDTLYIADLESSEVEIQKTETDITTCCRNAIHNIHHLTKPSVEIRFCPATECHKVMIPTSYVIKVITELLRNAITFTSKGIIDLKYQISPDGHSITISVADSGCGVPAEQAERIFDRFVKLDPFTQGLGLGLTVCRMIAKNIHADLNLDTSYQDGARFIFIIPLSK